MRDAQFSFGGRPSELVVLRAKLAELLRAEGWTDEEMAEVLVTAGELATNAVVHARTPFAVRCVVDDHVELEVEDRDPVHLPVVRPADGHPGGFGLRIVDHLARSWEVEQRGSAKLVRAVLDRPAWR
jgi:anti-sigma regulatory factor (Ser/Thr protein kinase)